MRHTGTADQNESVVCSGVVGEELVAKHGEGRGGQPGRDGAGWRDDDQQVIGKFAGDRSDHRVDLLGVCAQHFSLQRRARRKIIGEDVDGALRLFESAQCGHCECEASIGGSGAGHGHRREIGGQSAEDALPRAARSIESLHGCGGWDPHHPLRFQRERWRRDLARLIRSRKKPVGDHSRGAPRRRGGPVEHRRVQAQTLEERPQRKGISGRKLRSDPLHGWNQSPDVESDAAGHDQKSLGGIGTIQRCPVRDPAGDAVAKWELPGRDGGPQRLGIDRGKRLQPREVAAGAGLLEERQAPFAREREDPVVRQIADGDHDHRPLAGDRPYIGDHDGLFLRAIAVAALIEEQRRDGDEQHADEEENPRAPTIGVALGHPDQQQCERGGGDDVRRLGQHTDGADRQINPKHLEVHPVNRCGHERSEYNEAESVRSIPGRGHRVAEKFYPQGAKAPQRAAEQDPADQAVDDGHRHQALRRDVDLRVEEVQQIGHVQTEDRSGQNALEIGPRDLHRRASVATGARSRPLIRHSRGPGEGRR